MPSIFPSSAGGGVVVRDIAGNPVATGGVILNTFTPPASFAMTCPQTALAEGGCLPRITAAQANAWSSELLCLAYTLNPSGSWDCNNPCNLGNAFAAWRDGTGIGSLGDRFLPSSATGNIYKLGPDNKPYVPCGHFMCAPQAP